MVDFQEACAGGGVGDRLGTGEPQGTSDGRWSKSPDETRGLEPGAGLGDRAV